MENNAFYGELPPSICALQHLRDLRIGKNQIGGVLPGCLHRLVSLRVFKALPNDFTGIVPQFYVVYCAKTLCWGLWVVFGLVLVFTIFLSALLSAKFSGDGEDSLEGFFMLSLVLVVSPCLGAIFAAIAACEGPFDQTPCIETDLPAVGLDVTVSGWNGITALVLLAASLLAVLCVSCCAYTCIGRYTARICCYLLLVWLTLILELIFVAVHPAFWINYLSVLAATAFVYEWAVWQASVLAFCKFKEKSCQVWQVIWPPKDQSASEPDDKPDPVQIGQIALSCGWLIGLAFASVLALTFHVLLNISVIIFQVFIFIYALVRVNDGANMKSMATGALVFRGVASAVMIFAVLLPASLTSGENWSRVVAGCTITCELLILILVLTPLIDSLCSASDTWAFRIQANRTLEFSKDLFGLADFRREFTKDQQEEVEPDVEGNDGNAGGEEFTNVTEDHQGRVEPEVEGGDRNVGGEEGQLQQQ